MKEYTLDIEYKGVHLLLVANNPEGKNLYVLMDMRNTSLCLPDYILVPSVLPNIMANFVEQFQQRHLGRVSA